MSLTLFHSPLSPFVRKVVVLLHETGQIDRVTLQGAHLSPVAPSAEVNRDNPAGKIPALRLEDGSVLHDSRVILDYLDHQHAGPPLIPREGAARWRALTLASLADAILDATVLLRYESALRPEDKRWDAWQAGQREKIQRTLDYLESAAIDELASRFDIAAIGAACALGYLDLRLADFAWRERYPRLAHWYAQAQQRPSMRASAPPA
ncbi:glutathione S-transferase family protein [Pseudomonas sp. RIT-PI-AD]|uniref:glutathione S-transferase family protein n=1 Tax=Pseudomonas sp. RIT-PI-AD TaxID=3035294 RepID=UPI0021DB2C78|nr:glutathione S-transferase family protein [Pseudomonas sp. RIT-PI-AD]